MLKRTLFFFLFAFLIVVPGFFILFYFPDIKREYRLENSSSQGVHVRKTEQGAALFRHGEAYEIRGAGGYTNFELLKLAGANSVRIWDTTGLQGLLDSAQLHGLTVAVGLDMGHINQGFNYKDEKAVQEQFLRIKKTVLKHRNHPAVLMWVIGNELASWRSWRAVNDIAEMIHEEDPLHPTTTTMINFQPKNNLLIKWFCPAIDILSINTFGALAALPEEINHWLWGWRGPYVVMEWGSSGKWEVETTSWGAPIEETSTKKAELILDRYERFQQQEDGRCLGNYVFYWGQKNEATPTWFSIFTPQGYPTEAVKTMSGIWNSPLQHQAYPQVSYLLLDGQGSSSDIKLQAGKSYESKVVLPGSGDTSFSYQYQLFKETAFPGREEADSLDYIPLLETPFLKNKQQFRFMAPKQAGAYRLYVYVKNPEGQAATTNVPFFVFE